MPSTKAPQSSGLWQTLNLAWELGYTIAIPLVILGLLGAYLDKKLETLPLFLLLGIVFATIVSGLGIYRKIQKIINPPNDKLNSKF